MGCGSGRPCCCCTSKSEEAKKTVVSSPIRSRTPISLPVKLKPRSRSPSSSRSPSPLPEPDIIDDFIVVWLDPSIDRDSKETQAIQEKLEEVVNTVEIYTDPKKCYAFIKGVKEGKIFLIVSEALEKRFIRKVQHLPQIDSIYRLHLTKETAGDQSDPMFGVYGPYPFIEDLIAQLEIDVKTSSHNMVSYECIGGSSSEIETKNNQYTSDDESAEESSVNDVTEGNRYTASNKSTGSPSSKTGTKKYPGSDKNKHIGKPLSKIGTKRNQNIAHDESIEESFLKNLTKDDQHMSDDESTEQSFSKAETKDNQYISDDEPAEESSSKAVTKTNQHMVDQKSAGSSSLQAGIKRYPGNKKTKHIEGSITKVGKQDNQSTTDDEYAKESSSKIVTRTNQHMADGESKKQSFSKPKTKNNQYISDDESAEESSSKIVTKTKQHMTNQKPPGSSFSKTGKKKYSQSGKNKDVEESISEIKVKQNQENVSDMYDQIFKDIVLKLKEDDLQDFYKFLSTLSKTDPEQQPVLSAMKKSNLKKSAIHWYTQETSLYRVLNRALRLREYDKLYDLRVYIRYLDESIAKQKTTTGLETKQLYRGQLIAKKDFESTFSKVGRFVYTQSFWSTSENPEVALGFAEVKEKDRENCVGILIKIRFGKDISFTFANIEKLSFYKREKEWLFSSGFVFRIDAVEKCSNELYHIDVTSMNEKNEKREIIKEYFRTYIDDTTVCLSLAKMTYLLAKWDQSKMFYLKGLKQEKEWRRKAAIYNNLGLICSKQEAYEKARKYYNKALTLEEVYGGSNPADLASTYNNIGAFYYKQGEEHLAIDNFQKAIEAYNRATNKNGDLRATLCNNMAWVHNAQGKHRKALENSEECVNIRVNSFPEFDPTLAITCNSIAITYYYQGSFKEAVNYAKNAVEIDNLVLPSDHPQTKIHKENLEHFRRVRSGS